MADSMRTKAVLSLGVTLLVILCAGCVFHKSGKPVLAGAEVPGVRPCDQYYARPWTKVCPVDAVFSGYHATCWTPWPEYWTGCPPPAVGVEIPAIATGNGAADEPPLAPIPSVFDEIEPPASPVPELMEPDVPSPPEADAPAPEVDTKEEPSPFVEEPPPQKDETPSSSKAQEGVGRPPDPSLGQSDPPPNVGHVSNVPTTQRHVGNVPHEMRAPRAHLTTQGFDAEPERDLAPPLTIPVDAGVTGTGEKDSADAHGRMPPAPLPKDALSRFARPADTMLPAVPNERLPEGDRENAGASEEDSPGWAFCSDEPVTDAVQTSRQRSGVRIGLSQNSTSLSALLHAPTL